jgi:hypothetical protein
MTDENSPLEEILKIEKDIIRLKRNTNYMKIRKGLQKLESMSLGNRLISIPSPQNLQKEIRIRRRSKEMKSIKKMYIERLSEFDQKIGTLYEEKEALEEEIFDRKY